MNMTGDNTAAKRGRVLLMDDEEVILEVTEEFLEAKGYEVETAGNGPEALVLYRLAIESGRPFDAVVMDLVIPEGKGGRDVIGDLLQMDPGARAIAMSGNPSDPAMERYADFGFKAALVKPCSSAELVETVRRVIEEDGGRSFPP